MIAKKVAKAADVRDSFRALAEYVAGARDPGEKLVDLWIAGCDAGSEATDLDAAVAEVEATRARKPAGANLTYRPVVSLREGEALDGAQLREAERVFAGALGFEEHQRIAAAHGNTDNFHMHVAYNRVHPRTGKAHSPWGDYGALERTCRDLERRFGLSVDLGMSDYGRDRAGPTPAARDFEARTWRQSFQGYCLEHRDEIVSLAGEARDWRELHDGLAGLGVELRRRGAGLAFTRAGGGKDGREAVKASLVDRSLSKAALEKRLGAYAPPRGAAKDRPRRRYDARPLTRHPAAPGLWRRFGSRRPRRRGALRWLSANWRNFLLDEAYRDPEALVIVLAYKELLGLGRGGSAPASARPALRRWAASARWAKAGGKPPAMPGLRKDGAGNLLVPFRDADGHLRALQAVAPDGRTAAIGDVRQPGLLHVCGADRRRAGADAAPVVVLAGDYATAAAVHAATGAATALAPPAAGARASTAALRRRRPGCRIVAVGGAGFVESARALGLPGVALAGAGGSNPAALRARLAPALAEARGRDTLRR